MYDPCRVVFELAPQYGSCDITAPPLFVLSDKLELVIFSAPIRAMNVGYGEYTIEQWVV